MRGPRRRGFTLIELLVVVTIVILVSAVTLPTVLPALSGRQVNESARILQAAIAGARDSAIRANAPRGIRLLPDLTLSSGVPTSTGLLFAGQQLTASRIVPIEPAPDLTDSSTNGSASFVNVAGASWSNASGNPPAFPFPIVSPSGFYPFPVPGTTPAIFNVLIVAQAIHVNNRPPGDPLSVGLNPPTNWFWNVRIGDKFRFHDSGRYYTVVGPMTTANPENFVNDGPADNNPFGPNFPSLSVTLGNNSTTPPTPVTQHPEFLFLVNGADDDGDGFIDPGLDGVDMNPPPVIVNGVIDEIAEWVEQETWLGSQATANAFAQLNPNPPTFKWVIARRPVVSPGAREVSLPAGATIDLTTWDTTAERSRLPVNPFNGTVDILINQAGQMVPTNYYSSPSSFTMAGSFLHFWIADRADVTTPVGTSYPTLPISDDAANVPSPAPAALRFLKKDRFLVTVFSRSGQVVTNSIESFDYADINRPYADAQLGIREAK